VAERDGAGERAKLGAFEASLRRGARMRWPASGVLGLDDRIEFDPGTGDLLELRHAPSRRFLRREPVHEILLIELAHALADIKPGKPGAPGTLRLGRVVYRAGTDRLAYQSTRSVGTLTLAEASPERFVIDAALTLINPEIDSDHIGAHQLAGVIVLERT
jgi:hypothetical protein